MKQEGGNDSVLEYLKPNIKRKVEPLLRYILKKDKITWNEEGEINGVPRSYISDLFKDAVV